MLPPPGAGSRYPDAPALQAFFDEVETGIRTIPGVRAVAWATTLPLGGSDIGSQRFEVAGEETPPDDLHPQADYQVVSPSYFEAVDLPIVAGHAFSSADRAESTQVCIVNEAFVKRYLPGRNPIGTRIISGASNPPIEREIVGVARQVKERPEETTEFVQLYVPAAQNVRRETNLLVRTEPANAAVTIPAIRRAISRVDPLVAVNTFTTLDDTAAKATARPRFRVVLAITFAALAVALAMIGVFAVLGYSVQQRRREFGVRLALGATPRQVRSLVWTDAARVIGAGAAAGLAGAVLLGQSISGFLFGVTPRDPITFAFVMAVILVTAAAAAAFPAWRASRTDPAVVFRD